MGDVIQAAHRFRPQPSGACRAERYHCTPCTRCATPLDPRKRAWVSIEHGLAFCDTECWALWLGVAP